MSHSNQKNDACEKCGELWLTHHTLAGVSDDGKLSIYCYAQPLEKPDLALKYALVTRAAKKALEAEVKTLKQQAELDKQAIAAEKKREFDSQVQTQVAARVAQDIAQIEADHKKALEDGEATRIQLVASHDAKVLDLETQLTEARGDNRTLREEKTALASKLATAETAAFDRQLRIEELTAAHEDLKSRHKGLKDRSLDIVRTLISMGTRVAVLEQKHGVVPKVDPERIFRILTGEAYDDREIPIDELRNDPTPVPVPAPAVEIVTPPTVTAPQAVPAAPAQPTAMVTLDDSTPAPQSYVTPDDEGEDADQHVDDDQVVDEQAASPDDDGDVPSENDEADECCVCEKSPNESYAFTKKDGTAGLLLACSAKAHAGDIFAALKQLSKTAPMSAKDVPMLFKPIE